MIFENGMGNVSFYHFLTFYLQQWLILIYVFDPASKQSLEDQVGEIVNLNAIKFVNDKIAGNSVKILLSYNPDKSKKNTITQEQIASFF